MSAPVMSLFESEEKALGASGDVATASEEQLVTEAKTGQGTAFEELYERHAKRVFRVTYRITRNWEDAEDAGQDCFLSAFLHLKDFDGASRFATWLTRIAINAALGKLRKQRRNREVPIGELTDDPALASELRARYGVPRSVASPEEAHHQSERRKILSAAISRLTPGTRKAMELHYLQEHSVKETARILGITPAGAKSRMFHSRAPCAKCPY